MPFNLILVTIMLKPMAYLDPGTGGMVLQMVIGGLLGGGILLRAFWRKKFKNQSSATRDDQYQDAESIIYTEIL